MTTEERLAKAERELAAATRHTRWVLMLLVRIPLAVVLLCSLGFVMQCVRLGGIPLPRSDMSWAHNVNFFLAHSGSGVGILSVGLFVSAVARLALRKHQITALIIVILLSFFIGLFEKTGELFDVLGQEARWHPHTIAYGFGYATVMAAFWLGVKAIWRLRRSPASELVVPMTSTGTKESGKEPGAT